jgi:hypothetical protein
MEDLRVPTLLTTGHVWGKQQNTDPDLSTPGHGASSEIMRPECVVKTSEKLLIGGVPL